MTRGLTVENTLSADSRRQNGSHVSTHVAFVPPMCLVVAFFFSSLNSNVLTLFFDARDFCL